MSPTALLMIHDPSTIAMGNARDMEKAIETLNEVKESIINAYAAKTGLRHNRIADLMSNETWMNAKKAVELGFADEVLYEDQKPEPDKEPDEDDPKEPEKEKKAAPTLEALMYQGRVTDQAVLNSICGTGEEEKPKPRAEPAIPQIGMDGKTKDGAMPYEILRNQLDFLK